MGVTNHLLIGMILPVGTPLCVSKSQFVTMTICDGELFYQIKLVCSFSHDLWLSGQWLYLKGNCYWRYTAHFALNHDYERKGTGFAPTKVQKIRGYIYILNLNYNSPRWVPLQHQKTRCTWNLKKDNCPRIDTFWRYYWACHPKCWSRLLMGKSC